MLPVLGSIPPEPERSSDTNETADRGEGSPLEEKEEGSRAKNQVLYRMSEADQEHLAFGSWSYKWKASVTAETMPGGPDCLTATKMKIGRD